MEHKKESCAHKEAAADDGEEGHSGGKRIRESRDRREGGRTWHRNRGGQDNERRLSEKERAARILEMQEDAELHEKRRWIRVKKADQADALDARPRGTHAGGSFLEVAQKSAFGTGLDSGRTVEESVRRRTHYSRIREEGNAFRR